MRILVIHTSAGAGHTKAAEALFHGIKNTSRFSVALVDALDYTSPFYKSFYQRSYTLLVTRLSWLWGFSFWLTDRVWLRGVVKFLRRLLNSRTAKRLEKFLEKEQFDYIFSTHFFPCEVISSLKRKSLIHSKLMTVVTDFDVHTIWLSQGTECYTVACDETKERLKTLGVPEDKIAVTGIPVHEKFLKKVNPDDLKDRLGLKKNIFTVLIATGSFGSGPIEKIVQALKDYQVLVVCGRNAMLFSRLGQKNLKHTKVYGLVHNMDELMKVSDGMVTKPGGLSICEAFVCGLPLIFFSAIPGQETHNVEVLHRYGIGVFTGNNISKITEEIKRLSTDKEYLISAKKNIERLTKPSCVRDIIQLIT